jgi:hypothetical protein
MSGRRKRVCARAPFKAHRDSRPNRKESITATVPAKARDWLSAEQADVIVFEEGSTWAAEDAAGRGRPYLVVYLEKAPVEESAPAQEEQPDSTFIPLAEVVQRRLDDKRRV